MALTAFTRAHELFNRTSSMAVGAQSPVWMEAMTNQVPYVITISRQLGSGGADLGRALAADLDIPYADLDIVKRAVELLQVRTEDVEALDESAPSPWESVLDSYTFGAPEVSCLPVQAVPSYTDLREAESEVIRDMAARRSAVIVGRAGFHWLANHPRHLSVLVHANLGFRAHRIEEAYGVSHEKALRIIEETDRARERYIQQVTGRPWTETLPKFDISMCTSALGLMLARRVLYETARTHLRSCA